MSGERTLLERIDAADEPPDRSLDVNIGRAVDSVIANLRNMLNVRQGSVEALPDFGMPDFNDIIGAYDDHIGQLQKVIREMVAAYEPRLRDVRVIHLKNEDDPLDLRFKVNARLQLQGEESAIEIETVVGDGGQVAVKG